MGFSVMLRGAEKLVPAEYWCLYGTHGLFHQILINMLVLLFSDIKGSFMNVFGSYLLLR